MCYNCRECYKNEENKELSKIDKEFPVIKKVGSIFELFIEDNGQLNIVECCDNYFYEQLSIDDLQQLSQYFLRVANYMEEKNMFFDEVEEKLRNRSKKCLPQLEEIKKSYSCYYKQPELIDKAALVLLLKKAIEKLDILDNGDFEIDERDAMDILCDQEFIFEDLVNEVIQDCKLFYNEGHI